jgi:hypothetical protein
MAIRAEHAGSVSKQYRVVKATSEDTGVCLAAIVHMEAIGFVTSYKELMNNAVAISFWEDYVEAGGLGHHRLFGKWMKQQSMDDAQLVKANKAVWSAAIQMMHISGKSDVVSWERPKNYKIGCASHSHRGKENY